MPCVARPMKGTGPLARCPFLSTSSSFKEDEAIASGPFRASVAQQALDERGALAGHARARHDEVEPCRLGSLPHVVVHVRVDAERARSLELAARPQILEQRDPVEAGRREV